MKGKKRKESSLGYSPLFKSQRGFMKLKLQLNHWMQLTNFLHLVHKRKQTKIKCAHTHQGVCTELADLIYSKSSKFSVSSSPYQIYNLLYILFTQK